MPSDDLQDRLRALPGVDRVVARPEVEALLADHPRWAVVDAVRAALEDVRQALLAGRPAPADLDDHLARETAHRTDELLRPGLFPVVNATGVVLHTNLGRAPMAPEALAAMAAVQRGYSNLEYDLAEGRRGSRHGHLAGLIRSLTGAEAALVTNNNASAVMLALAALAGGGEVIVSRGELIEIGESFRIPDVCTQGGVTLVEVGTTNRTHDTDYARAVTERTRAILKVHRSNFTISGFTAEVPPAELVELAADASLPVVWDLGSGCLVDLASMGLPGEPTVREALRSGAAVVTFSGDKLLGGPQAGIVVGPAQVLDRLRRHPLMRAVRPGKATLAGLEATLRLYRDADPWATVPTLQMLSATPADLRPRAEAAEGAIAAEAPRLRPEVREVSGRVGGGALPTADLPSVVVALDPGPAGAATLEAALRAAPTPVVARVERGAVLLDVRTLLPGDEERVVIACAAAQEEQAG